MSLALQPALADDLFGNHPLTPEARDAFVTELLKKMTVDEKIGQLRLISVGPDNPKEAIRAGDVLPKVLAKIRISPQ